MVPKARWKSGTSSPSTRKPWHLKASGCWPTGSASPLSKWRTWTPAICPPAGREREATVRVRVNQSFFRDRILSAYNFRCCVTGLTVQPLLTASHIVPWAEDEKNRLNPRNGLCLNALHDRAFDRHLMWIEDGYVIRFSPKLTSSSQLSTINQNYLLADQL